MQSISFDTKEKLGQALFFDTNLSLTRNTSCATCHDPEHGFVDARFSESGVDQNVFVDGAFSVGDDGTA
ncbi:MAG: cytochrome c peroxidase, partial [Campylobacterota bacterium]|nr:cytochrome c peroxidase [Campylobacterota bacterium]